jgi:exopolyphosphatase/pppGpp-phosphohydrolase
MTKNGWNQLVLRNANLDLAREWRFANNQARESERERVAVEWLGETREYLIESLVILARLSSACQLSGSGASVSPNTKLGRASYVIGSSWFVAFERGKEVASWSGV